MRRLSIRKFLVALCVAGIPLLAACAHSPRSFNETDSTIHFRTEYLRENPDDQYREHILKGEVTTGMNFIEVLASWGMPEGRRQSNDKKYEYWTYFGRDDISLDWIRYTFMFEGNRLAEWATMRHVPGNRRLDMLEAETETRLPVLTYMPGRQGGSGKK